MTAPNTRLQRRYSASTSADDQSRRESTIASLARSMSLPRMSFVSPGLNGA